MSNGRAVQYVISHGGNCEFPQRARLVDPKFSDGNLPLVVCIPVDPFGSSRPKFCESTAAVVSANTCKVSIDPIGRNARAHAFHQQVFHVTGIVDDRLFKSCDD